MDNLFLIFFSNIHCFYHNFMFNATPPSPPPTPDIEENFLKIILQHNAH